jgi:hypothetical protein
MKGHVSAFTRETPKQWLEDWKKENPDKEVKSFDSSKVSEDRYSIDLSWEPRSSVNEVEIQTDYSGSPQY